MFVFVLSGIMVVDVYKHYCPDEEEKQERMKRKMKKMKPKRFWKAFKIMDVVNLLMFYASIGLFVYIENYQKELINVYDPKPPFQSFRRLVALSQIDAYFFAINGFLLWFKLFKYLGFHPKFKFLYYMLNRGLQDILCF